MCLKAILLSALSACLLCFPFLPEVPNTAQAKGYATKVLRKQTVEGTLFLGGHTKRNRCLIVVKNGRSAWTIVADRDAMSRALRRENGRQPISGDYVRVTFERRVLHIEGMDITANFFCQGEQADANRGDGGALTNIVDAFANKTEIRAYACRGTVSDKAHGYDDVRRACGKRHKDRYLVLQANGKGYFATGQERADLSWYPSEFDEGVVHVVSNGKLHAYAVYDKRYMEGAAGPQDNLPTAFRLE
ncbi:MAG: hypothetical protein IJU37_01390 [Desulfovibrio sp.]|nr:hypothetical protein [Desulfovibrio sp.]